MRRRPPASCLLPLNHRRKAMVMFVLVFATLLAIYVFWIRPILKLRPEFAEFYAREGSVFAAIREKLKGIKQKLSSVIVIAASAAVTGYYFLTPIVGSVDVSSITAHVPSWAWPLVLISITALCQFLRNLADNGTGRSWRTLLPAPRR